MSIIYYFVQNTALIIALMYLALKVREYWFSNIAGSLNAPLVNGLFVGFLTLVIMYNPYIYEGMRLDLREAPLYFISFVGGPLTGLIAAIPPVVYRLILEGPTTGLGIFQSILLPVLIGSLFFSKRDYRPPLSILNIRRMMIGFFVYEVFKIPIMASLSPASTLMSVAMSLFGFVVVLSLGWMLNDAHRHIIERKALEYESTHDAMTNLPNLRFFRNQVIPLVYQNVPLAIVMLDVDHFKEYNDTNGHPAGDEVLRKISYLIKGKIRKGDYVARYGGEEFILCFTEPESSEQAMKLAERIRREVEAHSFKDEAKQPNGKVTISVGVSVTEGNTTLEELIEKADRALYEAKRNGRNRVVKFEPGVTEV